MKRKTITYIAGPMRGILEYNFPAFDAAAADLESQGYLVLNPAQMDRDIGFNPKTDGFDDDDLRSAIRRDVNAVLVSDCVYVLPGWDESKGALAEVAVAEWARKPVHMYYKST